jgi:hypothetical protein
MAILHGHLTVSMTRVPEDSVPDKAIRAPVDASSAAAHAAIGALRFINRQPRNRQYRQSLTATAEVPDGDER